MRKYPAGIAIGFLGIAAILSACTPHHIAHKPLTPQSKAYENQAKSIVSACVGKSGGNVKSIRTCLAPGGAAARIKFETCAGKALLNPLATLNKSKLEAALAVCVEQDR